MRIGTTLLAIGLLVGASGCLTLYDDYVDVAAEMLILGVHNEARDGGVAFEPAYEEDYTRVQLYLFEAGTFEQVGDTPAEGATALLWGANMGTRELVEQGGGLYAIDSVDDPELRYAGKQEYELTVKYAGKERKALIWLPDAPWAAIPSSHAAGAPMSLSLNPDNFSGVTALVFGADGDALYDTRPDSLSALLSLAGENEVGHAEIPASAFPTAGRDQAVGVAGIRVDRGEDNFENFDGASCRMAAGAMDLYPVAVE